jgi:hypothetical protein
MLFGQRALWGGVGLGGALIKRLINRRNDSTNFLLWIGISISFIVGIFVLLGILALLAQRMHVQRPNLPPGASILDLYRPRPPADHVFRTHQILTRAFGITIEGTLVVHSDRVIFTIRRWDAQITDPHRAARTFPYRISFFMCRAVPVLDGTTSLTYPPLPDRLNTFALLQEGEMRGRHEFVAGQQLIQTDLSSDLTVLISAEMRRVDLFPCIFGFGQDDYSTPLF